MVFVAQAELANAANPATDSATSNPNRLNDSIHRPPFDLIGVVLGSYTARGPRALGFGRRRAQARRRERSNRRLGLLSRSPLGGAQDQVVAPAHVGAVGSLLD